MAWKRPAFSTDAFLTPSCWKFSRTRGLAPSCGATSAAQIRFMSAMPAALDQPRTRSLADITDWIFDLDNTLYPARCNLFAQVDRRIGQFIEGRLGLNEVEARLLQKHYFR